MDSVCSHLLSLDFEPGPVLCFGGQKIKVTQGIDLGPVSEAGGQAPKPQEF